METKGMTMVLKGWKFNTCSGGSVDIVDNRGVRYKSAFIMNSNRILIEKVGTTRLVRFPQFAISYVLDEAERMTGRSDLVVVNGVKRG